MQHHLTTLALAGAVLAGSGSAALAQSKAGPFLGPALGIELGYTNNKSDLGGIIPSDLSNSTGNVAALATYGVNMGSDWVGTFDIALGLNDGQYGTYQFANGNTSG